MSFVEKLDENLVGMAGNPLDQMEQTLERSIENVRQVRMHRLALLPVVKSCTQTGFFILYFIHPRMRIQGMRWLSLLYK